MLQVLNGLSLKRHLLVDELLISTSGFGMSSSFANKNEFDRTISELLSLYETMWTENHERQIVVIKGQIRNLQNYCELGVERFIRFNLKLDVVISIYKLMKVLMLREIEEKVEFDERKREYCQWVISTFDQIEVTVIREWNKYYTKSETLLDSKIKYLELFESIPIPIILLNKWMKLENMNLKAVELLSENLKNSSVPFKIKDISSPIKVLKDTDFSEFFNYDFSSFLEDTSKYNDFFISRIESGNRTYDYSIEIMKMKDISGGIDGLVILFTLMREVIHT